MDTETATEPAGPPADTKPATRYRRARRRIYELLHSVEIETRFEYWIRMVIAVVIVLNVVAVILETIPEVRAAFTEQLFTFEVLSVALFTVEYLLRVWSAAEIPGFSNPILGRLRYMFSFFALVDLLSLVPFYLPGVVRLDLRFLRGLRLMRLIRLLKLGRYSRSFDMLSRVVRGKREEILAALVILLLILLISSSLMYFLEHEAQPDAFPHIPAALWWGVATLTTIGYGDIYPVTLIGKICASIISILGIGLVALPSGILMAGFMEELQNRREAKVCPHCGKEIH